MRENVQIFDELSGRDVLGILGLREQVFVVEQSWPHREVDEKDPEALHLSITENGEILAYCRLLRHSPDTALIGRVIAARRGEGLGSAIVELAKRAAREKLSAKTLLVHAQVRVKGFYEKAGFAAFGEEFDELGVRHIQMKVSL